MNIKKKLLILTIILTILICIFIVPKYILVLNGNYCIDVECGDQFEDPGAYLLLDVGNIRTEGYVDCNSLGQYTITYSFLTAKQTRIVNVVDTTPPEISLLGQASVFVAKDNVYIEEGAKAFDNIDGELTSEIWIEGNVDVSAVGDYHLSYYAKDKSGNVSRVRRKISVTDGGPWVQDPASFDLNPYYSDVICQKTEYDEEKFKQIYFLGDSFVGQLIYYKMAEANHLWACSDLNTDMLSSAKMNIGVTLKTPNSKSPYNAFQAIEHYDPEVVVLIIGNSAMFSWKPDYFQKSAEKAYSQLAEKFPNTKFILCSFPPVSAGVEKSIKSSGGYSKNDRANKYNVILCEIARKNGMKYMNAAEALKDPETHFLLNGCLLSDNFHLNKKGNEILMDYIKHHMDW